MRIWEKSIQMRATGTKVSVWDGKQAPWLMAEEVMTCFYKQPNCLQAHHLLSKGRDEITQIAPRIVTAK